MTLQRTTGWQEAWAEGRLKAHGDIRRGTAINPECLLWGRLRARLPLLIGLGIKFK